MVSAALRGRDMGIEREEGDEGAGGEIPKIDNGCESQNARLYDQGGIAKREAKEKG